MSSSLTQELSRDNSGQHRQFIFSLFLKLSTKNHTLKVDMVLLYHDDIFLVKTRNSVFSEYIFKFAQVSSFADQGQEKMFLDVLKHMVLNSTIKFVKFQLNYCV